MRNFNLLILFFSLSAFTYANLSNPLKWNHIQIIKGLKKGSIKSIVKMKAYLKSKTKKYNYTGQVYLVFFDNGLKGVFKPGTNYHIEVSAYKMSRYLGFPLIPPTVIRNINGKKGSLQLFIKSDIDTLNYRQYNKFIKQVSKNDIANINLFNFVFGKWDCGPENVIILKNNSKTYLISIDNESIQDLQFVKYGKKPFVRIFQNIKFSTKDFNKSFPFEKAILLKNCNQSKLRAEFKKKLSEKFYHRFKYRKSFQFKYILYKNGLWRQYIYIDRSYTEIYPRESILKLKKLNKKILTYIFSDCKSLNFFTDEYIRFILDRRDQLMKHIERLDNFRYTQRVSF